MSTFTPKLVFDERDEEGVRHAIAPFVRDKDTWAFARRLAKEKFEELLKEQQSMTEYLGGRPLDAAICNGVLHPLHRGLGVVFIIGQPTDIQGQIGLPPIMDAAMKPEQFVIAKFWCSAKAFNWAPIEEGVRP